MMSKKLVFNKYGVVVDNSVKAAMNILYNKMMSSINGMMKHNSFSPAEMMILERNAAGMLHGLFADHILRNQMTIKKEEKE